MSIRRNTLWNLLGSSFPLLIAAFSIPYLLKGLGADGFGVLALVWALIGYFGVFDLGIGRALTYELSRRQAYPPGSLAPIVRAGLALTSGTGLIGASLVGMLAVPMANSWLNIPPALQDDARLGFFVTAAGVVPTTMSSGLRGALEGLNRFAASNLNRLTLGTLMFALPAWSLFAHGNEVWRAAVYLVSARVLITTLQVWQLRNYLFEKGGLKPTNITPLLNYGLWVSVTGIVGPLMVYGDRFFVSAAVGAAHLSSYAIPQEGLQRLLIIPSAICGALLPVFAAGGQHNVAETYRRNRRRVTLIMFLVCAATAVLSHSLMSIWISPEFADSAQVVTLILILGVWLNSIALVPYTLIHALGRPKLTAMFHLLELVVYVFFLWVLSKQFGLEGAATAWTLRVLIDLGLLSVAAKRIVRNIK